VIVQAFDCRSPAHVRDRAHRRTGGRTCLADATGVTVVIYAVAARP